MVSGQWLLHIDIEIGGSGFIATHVLETLLEHGHSVVTTVRSQEKADRIAKAYPKYGKDKLSFALVKDIAQEGGAFDISTYLM